MQHKTCLCSGSRHRAMKRIAVKYEMCCTQKVKTMNSYLADAFTLEGVIYMSYINGKEVLPENVLAEIRKYFSGGLIYIPKADEQRCSWGSKTATKSELEKRNREICDKKKKGVSIKQLMEEYHLAYDTIKKILYR